MTERIILFETSKLAKKTGYPQGYSKHEGFHYNWQGDLYGWGLWDNTDNCYSAPTQSVLQKYLRDNGIHIWVIPILCDDKLSHYEVFSNIVHCLAIPNKFTSYEDALEEGIYKALFLKK